jgi:hypothetical protein
MGRGTPPVRGRLLCGILASSVTGVVYLGGIVLELRNPDLFGAVAFALFILAPVLGGFVAARAAPDGARARLRSRVRFWGFGSLVATVLGGLVERALHAPGTSPLGGGPPVWGGWGIAWLVAWPALLLGGPFLGAWTALGSGDGTGVP